MATGTYCGTADLKLVYNQYSDLMGTDYTDFINAASDWIEAEFWAHNMTPPPVSPMTSSYDYWLRRTCALQAVYMAADSVLSERTDSMEGAWWGRYGEEAESVMNDIRTGVKKLSYQSTIWQNSISPAVPWVNGTVAAPIPNMLHTNGRIGGRYTDNIPRIFEVELDGADGTDMGDFTYRYRILGTSAWMGEGQPVDTDSWVTLGWGVSILWTPPAYGAPAEEQLWRIYCTPVGEEVDSGGAKARRRTWA